MPKKKRLVAPQRGGEDGTWAVASSFHYRWQIDPSAAVFRSSVKGEGIEEEEYEEETKTVALKAQLPRSSHHLPFSFSCQFVARPAPQSDGTESAESSRSAAVIRVLWVTCIIV